MVVLVYEKYVYKVKEKFLTLNKIKKLFLTNQEVNSRRFGWYV